MARGYPDFFGMPAFPEWGVPSIQEELVPNIASFDGGNIFSLTGKGKIGGGYFIISGSTSLNTIYVTITVDGARVLYINAQIALDSGLIIPGFLPVFLCGCVIEDPKQTYGFLYEFIYGQSFLVTISNFSDDAITIDGALVYFNVI